jgi:hypothetical protein
MWLNLSQEERLEVISDTCEQTGLFPQAWDLFFEND